MSSFKNMLEYSFLFIFLSIKIVSLSTVSINFFSWIKEGKKSISDCIKEFLALFCKYGLITAVKNI